MKRRYQLLLGIVIAVILVFTTACEDGALTPDCDLGGKIEKTVDKVEGFISVDADTGVKTISYHVPGTIDSILTGVVCSEFFPDFKIEQGTRVRFSGNFRDDEGVLNPLVATGGQEFFYLELTFIEEIS